MAYRRSISTIRVSLLSKRINPSFSYILHDDDDRKRQYSTTNQSQSMITNFLHLGSYNSNVNSGTAGFGALFREGRRSLPFFMSPGFGSSLYMYSSSAIGDGSEEIGYMSDVAEVLTEKGAEVVGSQAAASTSEVAIAAADSFFPVAALQHFIDGVHSLTGLNWWASIALTTVFIRIATVPLLINQLKATSKLTLMRPQLEKIKEEMTMSMDPEAPLKGQKRIKALFKEYGVTPFSPLKGIFIQGPVFISFFLAISNMVEKVPSFKEGGTFWFTDLTVPDNLYIFPVLTSLTFLIIVECNMQEGLEGNPVAGTMKKFSRVFGVLTIPFTMSFPKAIFFYWITSNLFSLMYGQALKRPRVKELLGLPEMPVVPLTTAPPPALSLFSSFNPSTAVKPEPSPSHVEPSKSADRRISSSSIISQRIRSLEKQAKGRKKNKKN